jgi:hypothetical protein
MARSEQEGPGGAWKWVKGCGCGCAVVALLAILALVGSGVAITRPFNRAIEARELLEERYGHQDGFTPPSDGAIAPERMEAFLSVRERLAEPCARVTESFESMRQMERFEGVEDPPKRELLGALWNAGRSAFALGPRMGELFRARNEALLDAEMGLGEYTYIFVIAYSPQLVSWREEEGRIKVENVEVPRRIRRLLVEMLRRQLAAVEGDPLADPDGEWAGGLTAEIARLEEDPRRIPWMEGLPPAIEASVSPYRERLDALLCEAALDVELIRNERQGIGIRGR